MTSPSFELMTPQLRAAVFPGGDGLEVETVIDLAVVRHVAERVQMGHQAAVVLDLVALPEEPALDVDVEHAPDRADQYRRSVRTGLVGVVERGDAHVARHRDRSAGLDQASGRHTFGRRDQVEGAELVVRAPAAPVRQVGHPRLELLPCDLDGGPHLGSRAGGRSKHNHDRGHQATRDS